MNHLLGIVAVFAAALPGPSFAEDTATFVWKRLAPDAGVIQDASVVLGRALSNNAIDIDDCPDHQNCMNAWFLFEIAVDRVIAGRRAEGLVRAARLQHNGLYGVEERVALMILSPIADEHDRQRLGAGYYLIDYSIPDPLYCTRIALEQFGLAIATPPVMDLEYYCYEPRAIAQ